MTLRRIIVTSIVALPLLAALAGTGIYFYLTPKLPSIESLKDVRFQVPLRVYTRDLKLVAEFGEKKRTPVRISQVPDLLIKAILSAEDDRFYQHPGVDYQGILRAAYLLVRTGEKVQGGSTITMQVARNFFLSSEKTYLRKVSEILLALKIERELTKDEILELYINKMYMGNRAYGVGSAAQVYYGKDVNDLNLAQIAMISGLYKAPSAYNPIVNPKRALLRRNYVLRRMLQLGFIDEKSYQEALSENVTASLHSLSVEVESPYVAEMVRAEMVQRYGNDAYTEGYKVYTTIDSKMQESANDAVSSTLLEYDERHGFRGPEQHIPLNPESTEEEWQQALQGFNRVGSLYPGLVVSQQDKSINVYLQNKRTITIDWSGLSWARPYISENRTGSAPNVTSDILTVGDIVRVQQSADGKWQLSQVPAVEGALISLSPDNGAINSLVGGFDFAHSKFNRVTQAERQPGSNFKPFIYSAALENGFTPATLINDAPVVFNDPGLESTWRPENYSGKFFGPTRLRIGLVKSRNLISIRLLRAIGIDTALDYVSKFGFDPHRLPRDLSLALGSGAITPLELATGYAVFANGGYKVSPYLIQKIIGPDDQVLMDAEPATVCRQCDDDLIQANVNGSAIVNPENLTESSIQLNNDINVSNDVNGVLPLDRPKTIAKQVIKPQNVYLMTSMMRDVIRVGTGRRARALGRHDLAGKTGTTNDQRDAWFSGFNSDIETTVWVGFDKPQPLGDSETGSRAALPMWIKFMKKSLVGIKEKPLEQPRGLVTVRIDPETGLLAGANNPDAIFETFRVENVPKRKAETNAVAGDKNDTENKTNTNNNFSEQLF